MKEINKYLIEEEKSLMKIEEEIKIFTEEEIKLRNIKERDNIEEERLRYIKEMKVFYKSNWEILNNIIQKQIDNLEN